MINNYNNVPENSKENAEEICKEIVNLLRPKNTDAFLSQKNVLPKRLKNLIALGAILANQQSQSVASCVEDCLKTGATKANIMQVLQLAILMAEIPVQRYNEIVQDAIRSFEGHSWQ